MTIKMTQSLPSLQAYEKSVYSQCGEDGIIEEILRRIAEYVPLDHWCVEFGALDGIYLSNTYHLIKNQGYKAVLIEGDESKYEALCRNVSQDDVIKICRFVTLNGQSSLDCILQSTAIPTCFDFLSIDIDGCDYHIFESLKIYCPKVICIEFNHSIPNEVDFVQPADFAVKQGSSARSLVRLAGEKGYFLAAVTPCNLLLVHEDFKAAVSDGSSKSLEELRDDSQYRTFVFFGYDGSVHLSRDSLSMPWHRLTLRSNQWQQLPRFIRRFGEDYTFLQKLIFAVFVLIKFPGDFRKLFREKVLRKPL
jgi:hypothetical protein